VRYPRGSGNGIAPAAEMQALPIGKGVISRQGSKVALLAFGTLLHEAIKVGEEIDATVANMRFAKPIDAALIRELAASHELLVSLEENAVISGAGSEVARVLEEAGLKTSLLRMGLPDHFIDHGDQAQLLHDAGLDAPAILARIRQHTAIAKS